VVDAHSDDPRVQGVRRFIEAIGADPRLEATALQTVGAKGHDGFLLARVVRH
jgi:predicted O-methyltransferase YrrM